MATKMKFDVADNSEIAMVNNINPISSGFFIGFLYLTIDNDPNNPKDSGIENWSMQKMVVIANARLGITRNIPVSESAVFSPTYE